MLPFLLSKSESLLYRTHVIIHSVTADMLSAVIEYQGLQPETINTAENIIVALQMLILITIGLQIQWNKSYKKFLENNHDCLPYKGKQQRTTHPAPSSESISSEPP